LCYISFQPTTEELWEVPERTTEETLYVRLNCHTPEPAAVIGILILQPPALNTLGDDDILRLAYREHRDDPIVMELAARLERANERLEAVAEALAQP
jgi:hypothetical protein